MRTRITDRHTSTLPTIVITIKVENSTIRSHDDQDMVSSNNSVFSESLSKEGVALFAEVVKSTSSSMLALVLENW